jgi:uncharacterized BrkB/YihY/UPF0761 family membrane protein
MQDFLTFKTFISPTVLTIMYSFGLFIMPIFTWFVISKVKKYIPSQIIEFKNKAFSQMRLQDKVKVIFFALLMLLCMEICWRMMFEFLIAYMQMHDALVRK